MNKKGLFFSIMLIFIALAALSFTVHIIITLEEELAPTGFIAQRSFELIKASMQEDLFKEYIENAARFSSEQAIMKISKNGGFKKASDACGGEIKYRDNSYAVWNTKESPNDICLPDYYNNFIYFFNGDLNLRIMDYVAMENTLLPADNYEFFINTTRIYGIALKPVIVKILGIGDLENKYAEGSYAFKPSFSIDSGYDLKTYKSVAAIAQEIVSECAGKFAESAEKQKCVNEVINSHPGRILPKFIEDSSKGTVLLLELSQESRAPLAFALYLPSR